MNRAASNPAANHLANTGIVNARLTVTTKLRSGKRIIKIFRLKV